MRSVSDPAGVRHEGQLLGQISQSSSRFLSQVCYRGVQGTPDLRGIGSRYQHLSGTGIPRYQVKAMSRQGWRRGGEGGRGYPPRHSVFFFRENLTDLACYFWTWFLQRKWAH